VGGGWGGGGGGGGGGGQRDVKCTATVVESEMELLNQNDCVNNFVHVSTFCNGCYGYKQPYI